MLVKMTPVPSYENSKLQMIQRTNFSWIVKIIVFNNQLDLGVTNFQIRFFIFSLSQALIKFLFSISVDRIAFIIWENL